MALTSIGFGDDTVDEDDWARINGANGSPYSYSAPESWRPYTGGGTRTVAFAPYVLSGYAVGILWLFIFDPRYGLMSTVLGWVAGRSPISPSVEPPFFGATTEAHAPLAATRRGPGFSTLAS